MLTDAQMVILRQCIDDGVNARRRGASKSLRPSFKTVYETEIAELLVIKSKLEELNGKGKSGSSR